MYLKKITLRNVGPIENLELDIPFYNNGNPKPFIIVGGNGAGKTIILSHIVNSLISAKQVAYQNTEVEKGKVYKLRSPSYITSGNHYSYAEIVFEKDLQIKEWQLIQSRKEFEENLKYTPIIKSWNDIPENESSHLWTNFPQKTIEVKKLIDSSCQLYFPSNRFEDPAWLNHENLTERTNYSDLKHIKGFSNRPIICLNPLKVNQTWLLDLLFDRQILEAQYGDLSVNIDGQVKIIKTFDGYSGKSAKIYESILSLLKLILRTSGNIRFGVGNRTQRTISIMKNENSWIPNLFQLSTGETLLLNLFLSIIRDYDLSLATFQDLSDVRGVVVIDEIDLHLHTTLQYEVLPELIEKFPKVQFIVTTHSPLFLLGIQNKFNENGYHVLEVPTCQEIGVETFSEFENAYKQFKETEKFNNDINNAILSSKKPIVFVEGDYDIRYLNKAAALLEKEDILNSFEVKDGGGYGNLDKIWKNFNTKLSLIFNGEIILLYDCDTNKEEAVKENLHKKIITSLPDNPIKKGIENLFPVNTIEKVQQANNSFIDLTPEVKKIQRGENITIPEYKEVNKDEKGNLCNWLCGNGIEDDFENFISIFDILEEFLNNNG
jgi:hypothetical protein